MCRAPGYDAPATACGTARGTYRPTASAACSSSSSWRGGGQLRITTQRDREGASFLLRFITTTKRGGCGTSFRCSRVRSGAASMARGGRPGASRRGGEVEVEIPLPGEAHELPLVGEGAPVAAAEVVEDGAAGTAAASRHLQQCDEVLRGQAVGGRLGGGDEER